MDESSYSDDFLKSLIKEEKIIIEPPKKEFKETGQHIRNSVELKSNDGERLYSVFIRKHKEYIENFSIGLIYKPIERESFQLIRFNGNHGESLSGLLSYNKHRDYHIHEMTSDALEEGITDPVKSFVTKEYASYEQAICSFCSYVNIRDFNKYFVNCQQDSLFKEEQLQ